MNNEQEQIWLPVIGKSLAILAMHRSELGNSELSVKAEFLRVLGIPLVEVAEMLGSSPASLREMSRRKKQKGSKRSGRKKKG